MATWLYNSIAAGQHGNMATWQQNSMAAGHWAARQYGGITVWLLASLTRLQESMALQHGTKTMTTLGVENMAAFHHYNMHLHAYAGMTA